MTSYTNEAIEKAIYDYQNHKFTSIRACSDATNIPRSTLQNRLPGTQPYRMAHEQQQALTVPEEYALVDWIQRLVNLENPITLSLT